MTNQYKSDIGNLTSVLTSMYLSSLINMISLLYLHVGMVSQLQNTVYYKKKVIEHLLRMQRKNHYFVCKDERNINILLKQ